MPAYNFQQRFAPAVENGTKRQTIRRKRKRPTRAHDTLYLYTGMRTKQCRKLRGDEPCRQVTDIVIGRSGIVLGRICQKVMLIGSPNADAFARADGFEDSWELIAWFEDTHALPFHGDVIYW